MIGRLSVRLCTTRIVCIVLVSSVLAVILLACWILRFDQSRDFEHLLAGNEGVEIASLTLEGQGQKIILDDEVTLKYLTHSFRGASKNGYDRNRQQGYTYYAYIHFDSGNSVMVGCNHLD